MGEPHSGKHKANSFSRVFLLGGLPVSLAIETARSIVTERGPGDLSASGIVVRVAAVLFGALLFALLMLLVRGRTE